MSWLFCSRLALRCVCLSCYLQGHFGICPSFLFHPTVLLVASGSCLAVVLPVQPSWSYRTTDAEVDPFLKTFSFRDTMLLQVLVKRLFSFPLSGAIHHLGHLSISCLFLLETRAAYSESGGEVFPLSYFPLDTSKAE